MDRRSCLWGVPLTIFSEFDGMIERMMLSAGSIQDRRISVVPFVKLRSLACGPQRRPVPTLRFCGCFKDRLI